jgi:hypothetical protein
VGYAAEVLADSPKLYAKLGEPSGTNVTDSSTNNNTGTYVNTPTLGQAGAFSRDPGTSVLFTAASSQKATFPHIAALNLGDTLTIEFWMKHTMIVLGGLISLGHTGANGSAYLRNSGSAGHIEILKSNVSSMASSTAAYNDGNWHYVVYTKATSTNKLFVQAADVSPTFTNATLADSTELITLGADVSNGTAAEFGTVTLAHVAIYGTALSAARIAVHYREALRTPGHVAYAGQAVMGATRCWKRRASGIVVPRLWLPSPSPVAV